MADDILRRVPPQNLDAEQSVLGAILLDNSAIDEAQGVLTAEDFYRETHRELFRAMCWLAENRRPIDAITLSDRLFQNGEPGNPLEAIGGVGYIAELAAVVPTAANIAHYARIVHELAVLRNFASTATELAGRAFDMPLHLAEFLDEAERRLLAVSGARSGSNFSTLAEVTREALKTVEQLYENTHEIRGLATGLREFDALTSGLQPGELAIIGARTLMGKTALALQIAANVGFAGGAVAIFSLEMTKAQVAMRLLTAEARVDYARLRLGLIAQEDFPRLAVAAARLAAADVVIDDDSSPTPIMIKAACRRLNHRLSSAGRKLGLVVVDYLQLMNPGIGGERREHDVAAMTRSLKALAKELQAPVLALSQVNRLVESRADRRPMLADLRESGAIEQDADLVAFIYRDEVYHRDSPDNGVAEIIVAKQRNGPTDTVRVAFLRQFTRFEDLER